MTISTNSALCHLPNVITLARMAAGMIGAWCLIVSAGQEVERAALVWGGASAVIFVLAALTDWLDGWLARVLDARSALGALLDPIADKVLVGAYLIAFAAISGWMIWLAAPVAVIVGRDVLVTALRFTRPAPATLNVTGEARTKTALAMIMTAAPFVLVTLDLATPLRLPVEVWFFYWVGGVWFIAILTAWTALPYVRGALGRG
ncbi:CDP-alcohol phosphatidyltransferase family protein [Hyphomonadaceae bacterium BL14]|nr:CDP-alcohol phosphatidyltransferase family protein [Hyphomonadaceae bacterium BL14]